MLMHFFHSMNVCCLDSCSYCVQTKIGFVHSHLSANKINSTISVHLLFFLFLNSSTTSSNNQTTNNSSALSPLRTNLPKPNYISEMNSPLIQVRIHEVYFPRKYRRILEYKYRNHSLILYLKSSANASTRLGQM